MAAASQFASVRYSETPFGAQAVQGGLIPGGLDLTTPALRLSAGALRDMLNFEVSINGGYTRIKGYERFDGQPAPSSATYTIVELTSLVTVPPIGTLVSQVGSGAQGVVASVVAFPVPYLVLTEVIGVFDDMNALTTLDNVFITVGAGRTKINGCYLTIGTVQAPPAVADPTSNLLIVVGAGRGVVINGSSIVVNASPDLTRNIFFVTDAGSNVLINGSGIVINAAST